MISMLYMIPFFIACVGGKSANTSDKKEFSGACGPHEKGVTHTTPITDPKMAIPDLHVR